jgi:hypothetical protein
MAAVVMFVLSAVVAYAQAPDFSGTWKLNKQASQIATGAGLAGLGAGGAPPTLYVTHAANGNVVVGSDVNESQARLYQFEPSKGLAAEREGSSEQFTVSADGKTLTVKISTGAAATTLVYSRTQSADPCESWPTPCRW